MKDLAESLESIRSTPTAMRYAWRKGHCVATARRGKECHCFRRKGDDIVVELFPNYRARPWTCATRPCPPALRKLAADLIDGRA